MKTKCKSIKEVLKEFDLLQDSLYRRLAIVIEMKTIMAAEKFDAKKYYSLANEYKRQDIITRQMELELIGLC